MRISMRSISKSYGLKSDFYQHVLSDIDLDIEEGEFVIFQGASGCGKSTLLNILSGHVFPTKGSVQIDGQNVTAPHPSRILLFQHPTLIPWLNVKENIEFGCKIRKEKKGFEKIADYYIELFGLKGKEDTYPAELSVGMAHRVCIARALMAKPRLLLLDEPFRSLDTKNSLKLMREIIDLWEKNKFTVVFVTHNIEESILLGTRVIVLGGNPTKIVDSIPVDLKYPRNIRDRNFIDLKKKIYKACEIDIDIPTE